MEELDYYMTEGCGVYAMAVARQHPNAEIYILSRNGGEEWSQSIPYEVTHVYCHLPDVGDFDVKGKRTPDQMAVDFDMAENYSIKGPFSPQEFYARFMGNSGSKPLYGTKKDIKEVKVASGWSDGSFRTASRGWKAYAHDYCMVFAIAVHRLTGWPMLKLTPKEVPHVDGVRDWDYHGGCNWHIVLQKSDGTLFDSYGSQTPQQIARRYHWKNGFETTPYVENPLSDVTDEELSAATEFAISQFGKLGANKYAKKENPVWDSPAFKQWFSGSKVVNGDGTPKVVYHGTKADFDVFVQKDGHISTIFGNEPVQRTGFYFADNPQFASDFADAGEGHGGHVMPCYLSVKNPADFINEAYDIIDKLETTGFNRGYFTWREMWEFFDGEDGAVLVESLKKVGYDGALIIEEIEGVKSTVYIAFNPRQIKSAIGNGGNFSIDEDSITASVKTAYEEIEMTDKAFDLLGGILENDEDLKDWTHQTTTSHFMKLFKGKKVAVIDDLHVHQRGKGVGSRLLEAFINKARAAGCDAVSLQANIFKKQEKGFDLVQWYERHGFQTKGFSGGLPLMVRWLKQPKTSAEARPLFIKLREMKPLFVAAAQKVYDRWNRQKYGDGICVDIAGKFCNIVNKRWFELQAFAEDKGANKSETHTYAVVFSEHESYAIDLPYWKYETAKKKEWGGYLLPRWKKIEGIKFQESDIRIVKIPRLPFMDSPNYKRSWRYFQKYPVTPEQKTAAGFPTKSFKKLWHVGDMDITKKRPASHEGSGLSVSVNPNEWRQISRGTDGPTWELTKPGNKFLNYHSLSDAQTSAIASWALAEGYVAAQTVYRVSWYDDEMEDTMFSDYPTKQQAEHEAGGEDGYKVTEVPGTLTATAKMHTRMGETVDQAFVDDFAALIYAEDKLGCDGVWWSDFLDVATYSAPRGVIFNSTLSSWTKRKHPATTEQKTAADNLKAWFNGSEVVNPDGSPKVVYHGTGADIESFSYEFTGKGNDQLGSGFYFTDNPGSASGYAMDKSEADKPNKGNVMPVYLAIKKPIHVSSGKAKEPDLSAAQIRRIILAAPELDYALTNFGDVKYEGRDTVINNAVKLYANNELLHQLFTLGNDFYNGYTKEFNEVARGITGYDGVISSANADDLFTPNETHYVAWFPNQIKSAIGNTGEYNREDNRITASPNFNYSQYNDREDDFKNIIWKEDIQAGIFEDDIDGTDVTINAYMPQKRKPFAYVNFETYKQVAYVGGIKISDEWRGTGLGQLLYDKAIAKAKALGMKRFSAGARSHDALDAWKRLAQRYPVIQIKGKRPYIDLASTKGAIITAAVNSKYDKVCYEYNREDNRTTAGKTDKYLHFIKQLQKEIVESEGSLEGMCYDACLDMKHTFPELHWYEGRVCNRGVWEPHSWVVAPDGTIYDPTVSQFKSPPTYEINGETCFVRKIDGKKIKRGKTMTASTLPPRYHPAFQAWFGDSKVVDESGYPKMVFHATNEDFDTFNTEPREVSGVHSAFDSIGAWFASNDKLARAVHDFYLKRRPGAPRTMPVYLSIKNPLVIQHRGLLETVIKVKTIDSASGGGLNDLMAKYDEFNRRDEKNDVTIVEESKAKLIKQGYDGIHILDDIKLGEAWIAFFPNQIKSAIGNNMEYSQEDNRITASRPLYSTLMGMRESLCEAAQWVYDGWSQDPDDSFYEPGGICDVIADEMINLLPPEFEWEYVRSETPPHTYFKVTSNGECCTVNLPPDVYEALTGRTVPAFGSNKPTPEWEKVPNVVFKPEDIEIKKTAVAKTAGYTAYVLTNEARELVLKNFPPKFPDVLAHHITISLGTKEPQPATAKVTIEGYASDESLEALICSVDDSTTRPDGGIYHITLSLDRSKGRRPMDSNATIKASGWTPVETPFEVKTLPQKVASTTTQSGLLFRSPGEKNHDYEPSWDYEIDEKPNPDFDEDNAESDDEFEKTSAFKKTIYHVSEAKDEQSIKQHGINPSLSERRWNPDDQGFYAFTEYADALNYAMNTVSRVMNIEDTKSLIWEVKPTGKLTPDHSFFIDGAPEEWTDDEGHSYHSSVFHSGWVPKQNVRLVATYDPETGDINENLNKIAADDVRDTPAFKAWFRDSKVAARTESGGSTLTEEEEKLDGFLKDTLGGFNQLQQVELGMENVDNALTHPEEYKMLHIGCDHDAWIRTDSVIFRFNNGVHFTLVPILMKTQGAGLRYSNGQWSMSEKTASISEVQSNPQFDAWFAGSKVVDNKGNPLVMYHATQSDFGEFRPYSHFGTQGAANDRHKSLTDFYDNTLNNPARSQGANVMPVYLSIKNPLRMPDLASLDENSGAPLDSYDEAEDMDEDERPYARAWEGEEAVATTLLEMGIIDIDEFEDVRDNENAYKLLEQKGYDGIVYKNVVEDAGKDSWIVFRPDQVKSAIGNSGSYDSNNHSITATVVIAAPAGFNINDVKIQRGDKDYSNTWFAYWKGKKIGWASLGQFGEDELAKDERCIWKSNVLEEYRRSGIATKLYNAVEEYCKTQGWKLVASPPRVLSDEAFGLWKQRDPETVKNDSRMWNAPYIGKELQYKGNTVRLTSLSDKGGVAEFLVPQKNMTSWGQETTSTTTWVPASVVFEQLGMPKIESDAKENLSISAAENEKYLYHGTTLPRAISIAEKGLQSGREAGNTESAHAYLSNNEQYAESYASRKGGTRGVILRTLCTPDMREDTSNEGGDYLSETIPPDRLEIKIDDGWKPLIEWAKQWKFSAKNLKSVPLKTSAKYTGPYAFYIEVPKDARDHFWDEPPEK